VTNEFEGSPKTWPPLGMPTGSVRALLTLILVAVVVTRMARGADVSAEQDLFWVETLLIALSHYFTTRRFVELPPEVLRQLEDDGVVERERHPLFLPRNSIRILIVGAFAWLTYYLYSTNQLFQHHALPLISMMGAFLLGTVVRRIGRWWNRNSSARPAGTMGDLKALVVLTVMLAVAVPEFMGSSKLLDPRFHQVALAMMLFYFGSR
jgi:hypothetical protein